MVVLMLILTVVTVKMKMMMMRAIMLVMVRDSSVPLSLQESLVIVLNACASFRSTTLSVAA